MHKNGWLLALFLALFLGSSTALAYTGSIGIFPPAIGGPEHSTNTLYHFDIDGEPYYLDTPELFYVEGLEIVTSEPLNNVVLIVKEYPPGDGPTRFDFIVQKKFNDALVSATVYVWAPDADDLVIYHEHDGDVQEVFPVRVDPLVEDGQGNVLWVFTVDSFSSFYIVEGNSSTGYLFLRDYEKEGTSRMEWFVSVSEFNSFGEFLGLTGPVFLALIFFALMSLSARTVYRRDNRKRWNL